ncbi:hypothetical protein AcV5_006345 [Taiwanofungus camphoratus]|nr:hypothetical protein AcW2_004786 [Antrodia cinnamomea]KAI0934531.1 hypothetical protein AcV5_006345 [Antrodia cinnamomea]KAI0950178.1 hypothetical protein AcV7_008724 [Antrodia cinnamomea]
MPAVFPPELFDETIDHLWDDPKTLKACSLTCRDWVPSSRLHLFRTMRIYTAADCARFGALLKSASVIAQCVRTLTISAEYNGVDSEGRAVEDDAWVNTAVGFLAKLTRVNTLGLARVRWSALLPETQDAFFDMFRCVRTLFLFEVRFNASRDVLDFLSAFPYLGELYFHGVSWAHNSPRPMIPIGKNAGTSMSNEQGRMQLTYLFLDPRSSPTLVTEWLLSHPSEQHLRTIQLCWREIENMKAVGDLLNASGASLEKLQIEFPAGVPEEAMLQNHLSLANNTGLRALHFGGLNVEASRNFLSNQLFPWVTVMLSQIRSSRLQEVTFELEITSVHDLLHLDWERIGRDLFREEFRGLIVMFYVGCADIVSNVQKDVQKMIASRLSGFQERGTLIVKCI